jgi:hypothetical protein
MAASVAAISIFQVVWLLTFLIGGTGATEEAFDGGEAEGLCGGAGEWRIVSGAEIYAGESTTIV